MWLCRIRFDLLFCVNLFARSLQCATKQHFELAVGRPLRYLWKTKKLGMVLQGGLWILEGYSDADLAGDLRTARSTSGYVYGLGAVGQYVPAANSSVKFPRPPVRLRHMPWCPSSKRWCGSDCWPGIWAFPFLALLLCSLITMVSSSNLPSRSIMLRQSTTVWGKPVFGARGLNV